MVIQEFVCFISFSEQCLVFVRNKVRVFINVNVKFVVVWMYVEWIVKDVYWNVRVFLVVVSQKKVLILFYIKYSYNVVMF